MSNSHSETEAALRAALTTIAEWRKETFPPSGCTWPDGRPMSYSMAFGGKGERDFMREIARIALASAPAVESGVTEAGALAECFETYASDQRACVRWQTTKRDKAACLTRAEVWADAAKVVRERLATRREPGA